MIRLFDFLIALLGLLFGTPIILVIGVFIWVDTGNPLFFQDRVGKDKKLFRIFKFRTMRFGTESLPTHLVDSSAVTGFGKFLRSTKLDELPQLWNVLIGDMSLVGPRPCLPTQVEVIHERDVRGVFNVRPGITGLSQINRIDMSTPTFLAETDALMLQSISVKTYFKYIISTLLGDGAGDRLNQ